MNGQEVITIKEYIDTCLGSIDKSIGELRNSIERQLLQNDKAIELLDERLREVENTKAVSSGQMKLMVGIFTTIPTILALIALFRG